MPLIVHKVINCSWIVSTQVGRAQELTSKQFINHAGNQQEFELFTSYSKIAKRLFSIQKLLKDNLLHVLFEDANKLAISKTTCTQNNHNSPLPRWGSYLPVPGIEIAGTGAKKNYMGKKMKRDWAEKTQERLCLFSTKDCSSIQDSGIPSL